MSLDVRLKAEEHAIRESEQLAREFKNWKSRLDVAKIANGIRVERDSPSNAESFDPQVDTVINDKRQLRERMLCELRSQLNDDKMHMRRKLLLCYTFKK